MTGVKFLVWRAKYTLINVKHIHNIHASIHVSSLLTLIFLEAILLIRIVE